MTHQDKISIIITFSLGFFAGAYLYLTGFAPSFNLPEATTGDTYTRFVVAGESYGECKKTNACLSFQLLEDGSYRALFDNPTGGNKIAKEASLPRALKNEINEKLTTKELSTQSQLLVNSVCQFGEGGTNYRFKITRDEIDYTLDTCSTAIDYEGLVWTSLANLWSYLATVKL